jgi:hypothetical protein
MRVVRYGAKVARFKDRLTHEACGSILDVEEEDLSYSGPPVEPPTAVAKCEACREHFPVLVHPVVLTRIRDGVKPPRQPKGSGVDTEEVADPSDFTGVHPAMTGPVDNRWKEAIEANVERATADAAEVAKT